MTPERFHVLEKALRRRQPDLTVLAEDVHKPHNISALIRTCDAVGVFEMHFVAPGGELDTHHLTAGGSVRWVRRHLHGDITAAVAKLNNNNYHIVAAHSSSQLEDFRDIDYTRPTALLLGSELIGVSDEAAALADRHVVIPMHGLVESFNVSVACALILYEAARQREDAGLYDRCRLPPEVYQKVLFEWAYPEIARRCRARGLDYPPLDSDGVLSCNPFGNGA